MTGIGIPPIDPGITGGGGSIWPEIVAAIVLLVVFAAAIWTYIRNRPAHTDRTVSQTELPKAA
ncbi:MAG TPA: hypothetical protein VF195_07945 [Actinomycetota bacterium]